MHKSMRHTSIITRSMHAHTTLRHMTGGNKYAHSHTHTHTHTDTHTWIVIQSEVNIARTH